MRGLGKIFGGGGDCLPGAGMEGLWWRCGSRDNLLSAAAATVGFHFLVSLAMAPASNFLLPCTVLHAAADGIHGRGGTLVLLLAVCGPVLSCLVLHACACAVLGTSLLWCSSRSSCAPPCRRPPDGTLRHHGLTCGLLCGYIAMWRCLTCGAMLRTFSDQHELRCGVQQSLLGTCGAVSWARCSVQQTLLGTRGAVSRARCDVCHGL